MTIMSCEFESHFLHEEKIFAEIAQLVEHNLAKVRVASSSLVFRSFFERMLEWWNGRHEGLKILWPLRLCGFKSRFEYSIKLCESLICRAFSL